MSKKNDFTVFLGVFVFVLVIGLFGYIFNKNETVVVEIPVNIQPEAQKVILTDESDVFVVIEEKQKELVPLVQETKPINPEVVPVEDVDEVEDIPSHLEEDILHLLEGEDEHSHNDFNALPYMTKELINEVKALTSRDSSDIVIVEEGAGHQSADLKERWSHVTVVVLDENGDVQQVEFNALGDESKDESDTFEASN